MTYLNPDRAEEEVNAFRKHLRLPADIEPRVPREEYVTDLHARTGWTAAATRRWLADVNRYGRRSEEFDADRLVGLLREANDAGASTYAIGFAVGESNRNVAHWIRGSRRPARTSTPYYVKKECSVEGCNRERHGDADVCREHDLVEWRPKFVKASVEALPCGDGFEELDDDELARVYAEASDKMRELGLERTGWGLNDFAETLIAEVLGGQRAESTRQSGWDVRLEDGTRVSVKARQVSHGRTPAYGLCVAINDWGFDELAYVLFSNDGLRVERAAILPRTLVKKHARSGKSRTDLNVRAEVLADRRVRDITAEVADAFLNSEGYSIAERRTYAMNALRKRGRIRNTNVVGELGERYAQEILGGELACELQAGYDILHDALGRVQVKTHVRAKTATRNRAPGKPDPGYDVLVLVELNWRDYQPAKILAVRKEIVDERLVTSCGSVSCAIWSDPDAVLLMDDGAPVAGAVERLLVVAG
jgi:hypothetical protein